MTEINHQRLYANVEYMRHFLVHNQSITQAIMDELHQAALPKGSESNDLVSLDALLLHCTNNSPKFNLQQTQLARNATWRSSVGQHTLLTKVHLQQIYSALNGLAQLQDELPKLPSGNQTLCINVHPVLATQAKGYIFEIGESLNQLKVYNHRAFLKAVSTIDEVYQEGGRYNALRNVMAHDLKIAEVSVFGVDDVVHFPQIRRVINKASDAVERFGCRFNNIANAYQSRQSLFSAAGFAGVATQAAESKPDIQQMSLG